MMIRGIYTAASGMVAQLNRQDVVANNLANLNTTGFKSDQATSTAFGSMLLKAYDQKGATSIGALGIGVEVGATYADLSNGPLLQTGIKSNLAISGDALFAVETQAGERYTRAGNFTIDQDNYLVTQDGNRVLGENGPIQVAGDFDVTATGEVMQEGKQIARLKLVSATGAQKAGGSLYTATQVQPASNFQILQGTVEQSNVNAVRQMLEMINITRSYETNQKALTAQDEALGKAVNELNK
jgi:flagellar basal-body rod protein FlgF